MRTNSDKISEKFENEIKKKILKVELVFEDPLEKNILAVTRITRDKFIRNQIFSVSRWV